MDSAVVTASPWLLLLTLGKTSLLAAIAVDLARQMQEQQDVYGDRPILWLVNEGPATRTVPEGISSGAALDSGGD